MLSYHSDTAAVLAIKISTTENSNRCDGTNGRV